ncbi:MAG TPA: tetratricopeptide repeat protein [Pyrinomonadaceae bacterium]|nr:tetratricopeptide repeat protein [Pyrinomonadaceae bacterium]
MSQKPFDLRTSCRYPLLLTLLLSMAVVADAQAGGGIDTTGTGGRHSISGRIIFPSGQRADSRLKVKLESSGNGDLNVLADGNGTFMFRGLTAGSYTVVVEGGDYFDTARETIYIEPTLTDPRSNVAIGPLSRPYVVQIYLRPKDETAPTKPGVLNAALASIPKAALELYDKGVQAAGRGETDVAIDNLRRAIVLYPNFGPALNELGVQYMKKGELDKAAEALQKVLQLSPEAAEPCLNYGIVLLQQKKFTDAEKQLRDAVVKNPNTYTAHLYFGITLIYVKNYPDAETQLRKAVTIGGPKASQAHYYLGGLYWQTGKHKEAADELETFLKLEPKAANADKLRTTIRELRNKSD